jgi:1,3-beta-glucanosyltransferase GAS1
VKGSKFFYSSNNTQFFVRGIWYSIANKFSSDATLHIDPLADDGSCARDIPHLLQLGINTIMVFNLNIEGDHSACLELLKKAGIYVLAELSSNGLQFRVNGEINHRNNRVLLEHHAKIITSLQKHSNVLGIFISLFDTSVTNIQNIAVIKAIIRDLKEYIKGKGYRSIPIGALGFDHHKSISVSEYMCCGSSEHAADFYSLYYTSSPTKPHPAWCVNSTAALNELAESYRDFPKPVILSYGCDYRVSHRFDEVSYIYSERMATIFSGAIADEWFNNVGLTGVDAGSNACFISYWFVSLFTY